MQSAPPDWSSWHPNSRAGHDLQIGQALGQLLAHNDRQTRVLERISDRLDDLPAKIAKALPTPQLSPPSDRLSSRDKAQLALAVMIVILALAGKMTILEAVQIVAKPLGM